MSVIDQMSSSMISEFSGTSNLVTFTPSDMNMAVGVTAVLTISVLLLKN